MSAPLTGVDIDRGTNAIIPYYDQDTSTMFFSGKVCKTVHILSGLAEIIYGGFFACRVMAIFVITTCLSNAASASIEA